MQLSDDGAAFIAGQEGAVDHWYLDQTGHWTIGIGHLWDGSAEFANVAARYADGTWDEGRRLSDAEMWELFRTDAARYVEAVDRLVTVELTQQQFDMLVDFAFNWGIGEVGGFPATSVLHLVNEGNFRAVAADLVDGRGPPTDAWPEGRPYDKGLAGVRRRRQLEAAAFVKSSAEIITEAIAECEAVGRPVVVVSGAEDRGRPYAFNPQGVVCHHTATRAYDYDYPSLGIVRDGRSDLPGPLAQFGLGRHTGTIYVIAFGYSNHAGGGGWNGLSGNGTVWGIEAENDGIGEPWGEEATESYIVLVAALLRAMGRDADWTCRHAEWSDGGKIDTATAPFADGDWIRARVTERLAVGPGSNPVHQEEDEMAKAALGVYDWDGRTWITDGMFTRPTNDPFVYLEKGLAEHLGEFTDGQHGELVERAVLLDVELEPVVGGMDFTAVADRIVGQVMERLGPEIGKVVGDELHQRLAG